MFCTCDENGRYVFGCVAPKRFHCSIYFCFSSFFTEIRDRFSFIHTYNNNSCEPTISEIFRHFVTRREKKECFSGFSATDEFDEKKIIPWKRKCFYLEFSLLTLIARLKINMTHLRQKSFYTFAPMWETKNSPNLIQEDHCVSGKIFPSKNVTWTLLPQILDSVKFLFDS